jgi:flagellar secretion chaperone FliS
VYATGYDQYRTQAASTASPAQLVLMLFDGCLTEIARAELALAAVPADLAEVNDCLSRAQAIVTELAATLDRDRGGEIAANLASLYAFCSEQLIEANVRKTSGPLAAVATTVSGIRDAWESACVHGNAAVPAPVAVGA